MARCLVTGAAGFIGSTLAAALLASGHEVAGVDCFTDYYARDLKERNLVPLRNQDGFSFHAADLLEADLPALLDGVEYIFHEAGQPGVRASWGATFDGYCDANILVTQRLLEAARSSPPLRFVYASSSSIYGDAPELPVPETAVPRPVSPYGVTKLAAEHLCSLYAHNFGLPTLSLRYFTVYGPRQRPDMAFNKFARAALTGGEIVVNGDGTQTRDYTYVDDIVTATMAAAFASSAIPPGAVYNLGGGVRTTVNDVIKILGEEAGRLPAVRYAGPLAGDARHTYADCSRASADLGYQPRWRLREGLAAEVEWMRQELGA